MNSAIITAASNKYEDSLFSLIGSLNCNWPSHPPIIVYDLGLTHKAVSLLNENLIEVRKIPPFCKHWRQHYTWKLWCLKNSEFDITLWMDAGLCVLEPLDEIISIIVKQKYFLVPHYQFLDYEATPQMCIACGVDQSFRYGKGTITTAFLGFSKKSDFYKVIKEAFELSLIEKNIKVDNNKQRPEQSLIAILIYKYFPNPVLADGIKYLGWKSPKMISGQKIWQQRRNILNEDIKFYKEKISEKGISHLPKDPSKDINILRRFVNKSKSSIKTLFKNLLVNETLDGIR